jgi:hypothetical protein
MNDDDYRLQCLKLAFEWGQHRFAYGFSGISQDDVLAKAQQLFEFVKGNDWANAA